MQIITIESAVVR